MSSKGWPPPPFTPTPRIYCERAGRPQHCWRHYAPVPYEVLHRGDENPVAAEVSLVFFPLHFKLSLSRKYTSHINDLIYLSVILCIYLFRIFLLLKKSKKWRKWDWEVNVENVNTKNSRKKRHNNIHIFSVPLRTWEREGNMEIEMNDKATWHSVNIPNGTSCTAPLNLTSESNWNRRAFCVW